MYTLRNPSAYLTHYYYNMQAIVSGEYQAMPSLTKEVARMEVFGRNQGLIFTIE